MKKKSTYWADLKEGAQTLLGGLGLSISHLKKARGKWALGSVAKDDYFSFTEGLVTLQYPREKLPVPEVGRYKLHNEIDDCIVCDKCAKICPVNCIDIEPVRAVEEIGKTSDGTPKRIYAAKFDIDMAKCCFCGLCTTVCPTECLTMTDDYDFSTFDVKEHNFPFSEMTPLEILEKKKALEEMQLARQKQQETAEASNTPPPAATGGAKPVFKPKMPVKPPSGQEQAEEQQNTGEGPPKPVFKPKMSKPVMKPAEPKADSPQPGNDSGQQEEPPKKPVFKPKPIIKPRKKE